MIYINLLCTKDGSLAGFEISGHANDDLYGKDIVCAAISSAAYMALNTITEIINADADVRIFDSGSMYLRVNDHQLRACCDVLSGFKLHVLGIEEQYPKNVIVNYWEV